MQIRSVTNLVATLLARAHRQWTAASRSAPDAARHKLPVAAAARPEQHRSTSPWGPTSLRVLIVDDCSDHRSRTRELLAQFGIEPTMACNGAQAVELASGQTFDIIFMDLAMPVMDGFAATLNIRRLETEQPQRPYVPVIAYTSGSLPSDELLRRIGFDHALKKPCSADTMQACLQRWCPAALAQTAPQ
jgi:CheY-like chemotaxis protein